MRISGNPGSPPVYGLVVPDGSFERLAGDGKRSKMTKENEIL
jgi:hypothetical protein